MTLPRKSQISLVDTKYYHCISRCVRRAFLCGEDRFTGRSYEHRRKWIEDKIFFLSKVFCIDICAYAVMSNHLHLVVHVDDIRAKKLSDKEVVLRWHRLFKGTSLTQQYLENIEMNEAQRLSLYETIGLYRKRLFDISWYMRILNEDISRRSNKEDNCKGRFWEGRFKSQALLDESALAACMAYVDLNPVRAQMAKSPKDSNFTSIQKRINLAKNGSQPKTLLPLVSDDKNVTSKAIPFHFESYIELVELTGQCISNNKRQSINCVEPILKKLNIAPENWIVLVTDFTRLFHGAVGKENMIERFYLHLNRQRRMNLSSIRRYLA